MTLLVIVPPLVTPLLLTLIMLLALVPLVLLILAIPMLHSEERSHSPGANHAL